MSNSLYKDAISRLDRAASYIDVDPESIEKLKYAKFCFEVSIPVRMDDGTLKNFTGFRVHHNDTRGPLKGGIRFHPKVCLEEMKTMAFWMSMKCAIMDIPFGGAKGGIELDPKKLSRMELERLSRSYIELIADFIGPERDILAPDMYTNSMIMGWMMDEYAKIVRHAAPGVVTGKPISLGGSLGREDATGRGAYNCIKLLENKYEWNAKKTLVAIQGFGNVGQSVAQLLFEDGYKIIAVSDSKGGILNEKGLDIPHLISNKNQSKSLKNVYCKDSVCDIENAKIISNEELLELDVDILIPAAVENQITKENAADIKASVIVEIANGPTTVDADQILNENDILVVPDIFASAGGVTVSYFEWVQNKTGYYWELDKIHHELKERIKNEFNNIQSIMDKHEIPMRTAAYIHVLNRYGEAFRAQGTHNFFSEC